VSIPDKDGYVGPDPKDRPFVLRLNPLFRLFGWECWWEWQYYGAKLERSIVHWQKTGKGQS